MFAKKAIFATVFLLVWSVGAGVFAGEPEQEDDGSVLIGTFSRMVNHRALEVGFMTNFDDKKQYALEKNKFYDELLQLDKGHPKRRFDVVGEWRKAADGKLFARLTQSPVLAGSARDEEGDEKDATSGGDNGDASKDKAEQEREEIRLSEEENEAGLDANAAGGRAAAAAVAAPSKSGYSDGDSFGLIVDDRMVASGMLTLGDRRVRFAQNSRFFDLQTMARDNPGRRFEIMGLIRIDDDGRAQAVMTVPPKMLD